jgi:hypothetical protein
MKKALYALAQLGATAPALAQNFSSDDRPITMSRDEPADALVKSNRLPVPDGCLH